MKDQRTFIRMNKLEKFDKYVYVEEEYYYTCKHPSNKECDHHKVSLTLSRSGREKRRGEKRRIALLGQDLS